MQPSLQSLYKTFSSPQKLWSNKSHRIMVSIRCVRLHVGLNTLHKVWHLYQITNVPTSHHSHLQWTESFDSTESHRLTFSTPCHSIGRWGLWEVIRGYGWSLGWMGSVPWQGKDPVNQPCEHLTSRSGHLQSVRGTSPQPNPSGTPTFQTPDLWEINVWSL